MHCTIDLTHFEYELLLILGRVEELNCTSTVGVTFLIVLGVVLFQLPYVVLQHRQEGIYSNTPGN